MTEPIRITLRRPPSWLDRWRAEFVLNTVVCTADAWTRWGALRAARRSMRYHLQQHEWHRAVTGNQNPVLAETIERLRLEPEVREA